MAVRGCTDSGGTVAKRGPKTNRPADVVAAAGPLFAQHGYGSVSLDDLATAMGISKSAIFYHYKRKAQILQDVVRPLLEGVDEIMSDHRGDPEAMFSAYVDLVDEQRVAVEVLSSDVASVMATEL